MPKFIAHRFEIHQLSGSISLRLTAANQREYRFEIAEHAVPQIREHLIRAFQLVDPPQHLNTPSAIESTPQDKGAQNELRNFVANAEPGRELISLRFEMAAGGAIHMTFPTPVVEMMFEAIGKALTVAKSEPTETRQ